MIKKQKLLQILNESNVSYASVESCEVVGVTYHKVHFLSESDLIAGVGILNLRKYSNLYKRIQDARMNLDELYVYVVPNF